MATTSTTAQTLRITTGADEPAGPPRDDLARLAGALAREFRAPIGLLDPAGRTWLVRLGAPADAFPDAGAASAAAPSGRQRAVVWSPGPDAAPTWLGLDAARPDGAGVVAWAGFGGAAAGGSWGPPCPGPALRAWGQVVADRLRAEAAADPAPAAAGPGSASSARAPRPSRTLHERLVRRLRVNDPPERFQRMAASALREALGVEAVAWVPASAREPVIVSGAIAGQSAASLRALASASAEPVRILDRLAIVAADAETPAGWLLAIHSAGADAPGAAVEVLQPVASLIGVQRANAQLYVDLKDLLFGVIRALTSAIDAKDPYTSGHSERVARIAVRLGEALELPAHKLGDLYLMGLLHDVGKIGVEDGVLKKPGKLTPEEFRSIQGHVKIGIHILSDLKKLHHLLPGVAYHHESLDGSGYPSGLSGESIPLAARILAVADAFDAMSSTRPYRRRLPPHEIDAIFRKGAGVQWDPKVIDALFACRADLERIRSKGLGESLQRAVGDALGRP